MYNAETEIDTRAMIVETNHGLVRELRLNRPPANALSPELLTALEQAVVGAPQQGARALVVSGAPGMFSAGLDLPLLLTLERPVIDDTWRRLYALMRALACCPVPLAAAITGHAPAGGTVISLFCDWRAVAEGPWKLGLSEVQVGLPLPPIILAALKRVLGTRRAELLAVSGGLFSPREAAEIGLVDEVVPGDQVVQRAVEWCNSRLALPPIGMAVTRQEARSDLVALFERDLTDELRKVSDSWWTREAQAAMHAVVDRLKRKQA
jgi:Delta3-Delta2-enoyl-CoA isomerase